MLAVCHLQGTDDMYYYSTSFSGGPGVSTTRFSHILTHSRMSTVALLTPPRQNALQIEGRQTV